MYLVCEHTQEKLVIQALFDAVERGSTDPDDTCFLALTHQELRSVALGMYLTDGLFDDLHPMLKAFELKIVDAIKAQGFDAASRQAQDEPSE